MGREMKIPQKGLRKGFTLIELLVVIAIIAILAAILFPIFAKAKEAAKRAVCLSNFKQIGIAVMAYVDDNKGRYPTAAQGQPPPGFNASNFDSTGSMATACLLTFQPYCKEMKIWRCPTGGRRKYHATVYDNPPGVAVGKIWAQVGWIEHPKLGGAVWTNYSAYAFNQHASTTAHPAVDPLCARGKTPGEFYDDCLRDGYNAWLIHDSYSYDAAGKNYFYPHRGGISGIFWDGHAKWFKDGRFDFN